MSEKTVYIWNCPEHGEFELTQEQEKAYCPRCGKEMERKGSYVERT